jgi:hypothetical protein
MQAAAADGVRLERMDGYMYAMAGAGLAHERTVARLIAALDGPARSKVAKLSVRIGDCRSMTATTSCCPQAVVRLGDLV